MALEPCSNWPEDRVRGALGGDSIAASDVLPVLERLDHEDARWIVSRLLSRTDRVRWAADCAEHVQPDDPLPESIAAIAAARAWADRPCEETYAAAAAAAYVAARAAAAAAAAADRAAAAAADRAAAAADAAAAAAAAAYAHAAYAHADAAAAAAAYADEHRWQLRRAARYLAAV
jgi:hypothetical protein